MFAIKSRARRTALLLASAIVGLGLAIVCAVVGLKYVNSDRADSLTAEGLLAIENDVLAARQRIKSGHVIVTLHGNSLQEYEIFFDGDRSRADRRIAGRLETQYIATEDEIIRVIGTHKPQLIPVTRRPASVMEIPDPRRLGLIVWFFESINQFDFTRHLARSDRVGLEARPAIRNGESVWVVTFRNKNGSATTEYWLARDKGNLPIYISVKPVNNPRNTQSIEVELSKWADGDVWFPKKVRFRNVRGDDVLSEETVIVEKAEFGRPIDDGTFRLTGAR